jgi:hypothetical protein
VGKAVVAAASGVAVASGVAAAVGSSTGAVSVTVGGIVSTGGGLAVGGALAPSTTLAEGAPTTGLASAPVVGEGVDPAFVDASGAMGVSVVALTCVAPASGATDGGDGSSGGVPPAEESTAVAAGCVAAVCSGITNGSVGAGAVVSDSSSAFGSAFASLGGASASALTAATSSARPHKPIISETKYKATPMSSAAASAPRTARDCHHERARKYSGTSTALVSGA